MERRWHAPDDLGQAIRTIESAGVRWLVDVKSEGGRVLALTLSSDAMATKFRVIARSLSEPTLILQCDAVEKVDVWRVIGTVWGQAVCLNFAEEHRAAEVVRKFTETWGDGIARLTVERIRISKERAKDLMPETVEPAPAQRYYDDDDDDIPF